MKILFPSQFRWVLEETKVVVKPAMYLPQGQQYPKFSAKDILSPANLAGTSWIEDLEMVFNSTSVLKIKHYNHYQAIKFATGSPKVCDDLFLAEAGIIRDESGIFFFQQKF